MGFFSKKNADLSNSNASGYDEEAYDDQPQAYDDRFGLPDDGQAYDDQTGYADSGTGYDGMNGGTADPGAAEDQQPYDQYEDDEPEQETAVPKRHSRARAMAIAGIGDFAGVILGAALILILIALLINLFVWVKNDMGDAIVMLLNII